MKHLLLLLLGFGSLSIISEEVWWKTDPINKPLYDLILSKSAEENKIFFYKIADNFKKTRCGEVSRFLKDRCEEKFLETINFMDIVLNTELNDEEDGVSIAEGVIYEYLRPYHIGVLWLLAAEDTYNNCELKNKKPEFFSKSCQDKFTQTSVVLLGDADKYMRLLFLKDRGLLFESKQIISYGNDEIIRSSKSEINQLIFYLKEEFYDVFCRSSGGIIFKLRKNCINKANEILKLLDDDIDLMKMDYKYLDAKMIEAFSIQNTTLAVERCTPFTLVLDSESFKRRMDTEEYEKERNVAKSCILEYLYGTERILDEVENILFKEDEWEKERERLVQKRIEEERLERNRELIKAQYEKERNSESIGSLFGRMMAAAVMGAAEGYVKEKISKELNIKTGVYHSQDFNYCYYQTPTGIKKVKKKSGKIQTVNIGNIGTNKPVVQSSINRVPGYSSTTTIYNFSNGVSKHTKERIYKCKSRI